jgi:phosphoserine phosphatase RsbU/P
VDPGAAYRTEKIVLSPGDGLLAYTDGVTEDMNPERTLYSEERLLETTRSAAASSPKELVETVAKSVADYARGEPQSDDITMLALRYRCPGRSAADARARA